MVWGAATPTSSAEVREGDTAEVRMSVGRRPGAESSNPKYFALGCSMSLPGDLKDDIADFFMSTRALIRSTAQGVGIVTIQGALA